MEGFLANFENLTKAFLENLGKLEETQKNVSDEDEMRNSIDDLFLDKTGPLLFDQSRLEDIYKRGELRYAIDMPPGYLDDKKEKSGERDSFQYGGLIYKRKFGDLILWQQIIEYAKTKGIKYLVLLTDDEKDDWWWTVDSEGKKRIGPRPELVEEIRREGEIELFYMYNSEQFLQYSKQYLQAEVSEESISQVREARLTRVPPRPIEDTQRLFVAAEEALGEWLALRFPSAEIRKNQIGFPDFVVYVDNHQTGFELKVFRDPRFLTMRLRETLYRAYYEINEGRFEGITIVIAMETIEALEEAIRFYRRQKDFPSTVRVLFGVLEPQDEPNRFVFRQIEDSPREKSLFDVD